MSGNLPSLPHSCPPENCHLCTKNEIFYTILHTTVGNYVLIFYLKILYKYVQCNLPFFERDTVLPPVILPPQPMHVFIKKRTIITLVNNIFDLFTKVNQKFSFSVLKLQLDLKPGFKNKQKKMKLGFQNH